MKNFDPKMKMKTSLIDFLLYEINDQDPIKLRIMNLNPMYLSDDNQNYLEITDSQKEEILDALAEKIEDYEEKMCMVELTEWKFLFQKITSQDKYFFDLKIEKFEVREITGYAGESKFSQEKSLSRNSSAKNGKKQSKNIFHNNDTISDVSAHQNLDDSNLKGN